MMISAEMRNAVRGKYQYRCGYCGISEVAVGGELEIDHFQPLSKGGVNDPDNLVYACTHCNRFKGNYWPDAGQSNSLKLLHPHAEYIKDHIQEMPDGRLIGATTRGWFHIRWLHLNRPQLVLQRQLAQTEQGLRNALAQAERANAQLQQYVQQLQTEIIELRAIIANISGRN